MKKLTILILLTLIVWLRTPITLPGEQIKVDVLRLDKAYSTRTSIKFKYNGKRVFVPYSNIIAFWEE